MKKSIFKRWWFWVIIGIVAVIIISASSGSDEPSTPSPSTPPQTSAPTVTYKIGDTVNVDDLEFTLLDVYNTKQIGSEYLGAKTENNYVVVKVKVKNNESKEISLTSSNFHLFNGKSEYEPNSAAIYLGEGDANPFYILEEIGSGLSKTISIVYETPEEYSEDWYIQFSYFISKEKVYLK